MPISIPHIPPLLRVDTLINGVLPPAIFLAVPRGSLGSDNLELVIEEFVHVGILPEPLKRQVHETVKLAKYRELENELRAIRAGNPAGSTLEDHPIEAMAQLWWKLTEEQRDILDSEGSTCFVSKERKDT